MNKTPEEIGIEYLYDVYGKKEFYEIGRIKLAIRKALKVEREETKQKVIKFIKEKEIEKDKDPCGISIHTLGCEKAIEWLKDLFKIDKAFKGER